MKLVKKEILHDSLQNDYRSTISDKDWQTLILSLWETVEDGLSLNYSSWTCNHITWDNWIGFIK